MAPQVTVHLENLGDLSFDIKVIEEHQAPEGRVLGREHQYKVYSQAPLPPPSEDIVLLYASHVRNRAWYAVLKENLDQLATRRVTRVVLVISVDQDFDDFELGVLQNEALPQRQSVGFDVLLDTHNIYYDFGKYTMGLHYLKQKQVSFNFMTVANDSFIMGYPPDSVWNQIESHIGNGAQFIGILESHEYQRHFQSWWLNMSPEAVEVWSQSIQETHGFWDTVMRNEVGTGNSMIKRFGEKAVALHSSPDNLFGDRNEETYQAKFHDGDFPFIKVKSIRDSAGIPASVQARIPTAIKNAIVVTFSTTFSASWSGSTGRARRLEAIQFSGMPCRVSGMAHVQDKGDVPTNDASSIFMGSKGEALRMEGFALQCDGNYKIKYRAHIQDVGNSAWCADGEFCGTRGKGLRIEAIQVVLVKMI